MKKWLVKSAFIALAFLSVTGCKKFLTTEVLGVYPESEFYTTQEQALQAITAAYQLLSYPSSFQGVGAQNRSWVFGDVASDDAAKGGVSGDQADIGLIDDFNITPLNGNLENEWARLYEGITRCNIVLDKIPAIEMDEELKARILAEAKFLRAYYYFDLVNIFGEVPMVLEPLNADELQIAQSPVKTIFETVIEPDLLNAAPDLPLFYSGPDVGRATKGAATALLAKAYLYQSKWDLAVAKAEEVIMSGQYGLMTVYAANFDANFKNNVESVFEVQHLNGQDPFTGNTLNQWFAPAVDGGYFFNAPTQNFVDEFEATSESVLDPRLDYTVGRDGMPWFNGEVFSEEWSPTGYLTRKHQQPFSEIPINLKGDGNINYTAIRYADVLLWYAEALNESGRSAEALVPLNEVRKRARESYLYDNLLPGFGTIPAGLLPDVITAGQSEVRTAIRHERRVELGFEFHRYFDVIRYGEAYAEQAFADKPFFNYTTHKYFPIPQSERDRNHALY
ncbi:MAG TPA: RagB/SusD family nutrient uptake outer membrane protein [Chitinophagales bacterium]|nr:RagB/SusD family nutrient uptake outer membrane protein [Chitinophagales bacterium]